MSLELTEDQILVRERMRANASRIRSEYGIDASITITDRTYADAEQAAHELAHWASLGFVPSWDREAGLSDWITLAIAQKTRGEADLEEAWACAIELEALKGLAVITPQRLLDQAVTTLQRHSDPWLRQKVTQLRRTKRARTLAGEVKSLLLMGEVQ